MPPPRAFPPAPALPKPSEEEQALLGLYADLRNEISALEAHDAAAYAEASEISARTLGVPASAHPGAQSSAEAAVAVAPHAAVLAHAVPPLPVSLRQMRDPAGESTFTTLGLVQEDVSAAVALREATHLDRLERPFTPRINASSASLRRDVPVHEMLLGKGRAAQQKLELLERQLAAERSKDCQRTEPAPKGTAALARRYSERHGQTAEERLVAPKPVSRARVQQEVEQRFLAQAPFSPERSTAASGGMRALARACDAFSTLPGTGAAPPSARLSRGGSTPRQPPGTGTDAKGRGTPRGTPRGCDTAAVVGVAERSATWQQLRDQKRLQQEHRQRRSESDLCPFKPVVANTARAHSSSVSVVERCQRWQEVREKRLQAAVARDLVAIAQEPQAAIAERAAECRRSSLYAPPRSCSPAHAWAGGEPRFMAPTIAANERIAIATLPYSVAWEDSNAQFARQRELELPEWAAPRAGGNGLSEQAESLSLPPGPPTLSLS